MYALRFPPHFALSIPKGISAANFRYFPVCSNELLFYILYKFFKFHINKGSIRFMSLWKNSNTTTVVAAANTYVTIKFIKKISWLLWYRMGEVRQIQFHYYYFF